jgi:hypothetical protein
VGERGSMCGNTLSVHWAIGSTDIVQLESWLMPNLYDGFSDSEPSCSMTETRSTDGHNEDGRENNSKGANTARETTGHLWVSIELSPRYCFYRARANIVH